ncbi:TolB family protein [Candidatus Zixiibacteriota bacterium]
MRRKHVIFLGLAILLLSSGTGISTPGEPVRLTEEKEGFICPVFSPDGRSIAMTRESWAGIWKMNSDGTGLEELTSDPGSGYKFEWSPDGRHIAYRTDKYLDGKRHFTIRIVAVETKSIEEIAGFERFLGTPYWISEDGSIVFQADRDGSMTRTRVLKSDPSASQIPGSDLVAGTTQDLQIWVGRPDGSDRTLVSNPDERCFDPIMSPTGNHVSYGVLAHGGSIAVAGADGSNAVNLGYGSNPGWSPDGRSLVHEVTADDGHVITGSELYTIDRDGGGRIQLTDTPDRIERWPGWSPDGRTIIFSSGGAIYLLPLSPPTQSEE